MTKFATGDFHIINGVLQTAYSIFEKYSIEMKSQGLWEEIKFVLDNFAKVCLHFWSAVFLHLFIFSFAAVHGFIQCDHGTR